MIGLNLCPFANAVQTRGLLRYAVSDARTPAALQTQLTDELLLLQNTARAEIETTLLVHPYVLEDFLAYNDFLDIADATLSALGLEGVLQVASFHPDYRFADTPADDIANYTNRSPYPTLHLLREVSVEEAVRAMPDTDRIYRDNIRTLRRLGPAGWRTLDLS